MRLRRYFILAGLLVPVNAVGHHGVATLGAAGIEGPGAPVETSSSRTLPAGESLAYLKLDQVEYETYTDARDGEMESASFWLYGLGHGFTPSLSAYLFVPRHDKVVEDNGYNTSGFADVSLMAVYGFKYDDGLQSVPEQESLADLEDWHFTAYAGATLPTGDPNTRDADGDIDPGMSLGFGEPSYTAGLTATRMLSPRWTWVGETSYVYFREHRYADGQRVQFGDEWRVNNALSARLVTRPDSGVRIDANLEAQYLALGRDRADGRGEAATGGDMAYLMPGIRATSGRVSAGLGVKTPVWTDLNEEDRQQGGEGKEDYRLILTVSALF